MTAMTKPFQKGHHRYMRKEVSQNSSTDRKSAGSRESRVGALLFLVLRLRKTGPEGLCYSDCCPESQLSSYTGLENVGLLRKPLVLPPAQVAIVGR